MPRFTVLHGERQEGRRENGEDVDVKKLAEAMTQNGFETAISHVFRPLSWREGPRLREMLLGRDAKPFYHQREDPRLEKASVEESQQ